MRVDPTSYADTIARVVQWVREGAAAYVCVSTVHMVMEAYDDAAYQRAVNRANLVTPDGVPLVWSLRLLGHRGASRVYGPDLTPMLLAEAARLGIAVGFYGGAPEVLDALVRKVAVDYPGLKVAYAKSPPFRELTSDEDEAITQEIGDSGAKILFVGLGCPKQERWMAEHCHRLTPVMLGVGAAFDFLTGNKPQAPRWMMRAGLEWLFRLATEPRRLWLRYLKHNPRYVFLFALQLAGWNRPQGPDAKGASVRVQ
jgi:N-acetylglucosaminyldiphosphoundecaprenol N-acetyl-beta-D-mannosaminyltransferase